MQIRQIYDIYHRTGVIGSKSPREYIDLSGRPTKSLAVKTKKKETFINELEKRVKNIPGPGKYEINPEDKQYAKKVYKKLDFKVEEKKTKKDFIEQVIKEKKGIPGVGKYELYPDNTERERQRHSILGEKARKKAGIFKQTIFDDVHVDCINVAPGSYQTTGSLLKVNKFKAEPTEQSQEKKEKEKHKRSSSLPKLPGAQTYRPIPNTYETFEKLLSMKSATHHPDIAKQKRFSVDKETSPGPKYNIIQEWSPRNNSKKKGANIFKSTSSLRAPSVYY